ncbi:MAG: EamA family transporter [Candidatus Thermoplasmatota archaeon]
MRETRGRVLLAFVAIYVIWGSTYFAIKVAIDTLPALLMAGTRFIVAGAALWMLAPGDRNVDPTKRDWLWAFILGAFLLLAGNGIVSVVETKMPTSITALLITSVPLWMVLVEWVTGGGRPKLLAVTGILLGFSGVALLAGEDGGWEGGKADPFYVAAILFGSLCWATGSILSRRGGIKLPILRSVAIQMVAGGVLLTAAGFLRGEWAALDLANASWASLGAWAYLVVFGSIIAFSAYSWLLTVRPSAMVSTYAFVNPVVAVVLGALFLDEPVGPRSLVAGALIVSAVALVIYAKARASRAAPPAPAPTQ